MNYRLRRMFLQVASVATVAATIATPLVARAEERHGGGGGSSGPGRHDAAHVDEHHRGRDQAQVEVRHRDEPQDNDVNDNDANDDRGVDAMDND